MDHWATSGVIGATPAAAAARVAVGRHAPRETSRQLRCGAGGLRTGGGSLRLGGSCHLAE